MHEKIKKILSKDKIIKIVKATFVFAILALTIIYMSEVIAKNDFLPNMLGKKHAQVGSFLKIFSLIFLLLISLYFAFSSLAKSYLIAYFSVFLISLASYIKNSTIGMPLFFEDYIYAKNIFGVIGKNTITITGVMVLFLIIGILVAIFMFKKINKKSFSIKTRIAVPIVTLFLLVLVSVMPVINAKTEEHDIALMHFIGIGSGANDAGISGKSSINLSEYNKGYLDKELDKLESSIDKNHVYNEKKPNIVTIMSESFSNINTMDKLKLSANPLEGYEDVKSESQYGVHYSPTYGGGTANVEYEVLTGFSNGYFSSKQSSYYAYVNENTMSLARVFKEKGYKTLAIHTYDDSIFARGNYYPLLGFDEYINAEDLVNPEYDGKYISDKVISDLIKENLEKSEEPIFIFAVTMENHQSYYDKYPKQNFEVLNNDMPKTMKNLVQNYIEGISHASRELKDLKDYLDDFDEDTSLLFYGDHQPTLSPNFDFFKYLGYYDEDKDPKTDLLREALKTEFLFWSNYENENIVVENGDLVGSNFLGNKLLDYLNFEKPLYFHHLDYLFEKMHYVSRGDFFIDAYDNYYEAIPKEAEDIRNISALLQYDILIGKEYVKDRLNTIIK